MTNQSAEHPIIVLSIKAYSLLLNAYPTKFREEFSKHMIQAFRDCCLQAFDAKGFKGILVLWVATFLDFIQSVISEYLQKEVQMKTELKVEDIRLSGRALVFGGMCFMLALGTLGSMLLLPIIFFFLLLTSAGLVGVSKRYGEKVGWFGKNTLVFGAILGPIVSIIGPIIVINLVQTLGGNAFVSDEVENTLERLIVMAFLAGPVILFIGLTLFGIVALSIKPLPRWNILPLISGIGFPFFFFGLLTFSDLNQFFYLICIVQGVALTLLGYMLENDISEEIIAQT
ncbi:MAG: hypothetical protein JNM46_08725 [Anaerolineales bacterium]|nr:hypothetical protein [Anaerolineales bacterium]